MGKSRQPVRMAPDCGSQQVIIVTGKERAIVRVKQAGSRSDHREHLKRDPISVHTLQSFATHLGDPPFYFRGHRGKKTSSRRSGRDPGRHFGKTDMLFQDNGAHNDGLYFFSRAS